MVTQFCKYIHPEFMGIFTCRGQVFRNGAPAWEFLREMPNGDCSLIYMNADEIAGMEMVSNKLLIQAFGGSPDYMEYPWLDRSER